MAQNGEATTTVAYGAITNKPGNITNSVAGWSTASSWLLNTTINPAVQDNGAFVVTTADGEPSSLRFGTAAAGPATVVFEGATFPAITNPENTLNGITRITIDAEAGAAGSLTASVAGVKPTQYAINYGTKQSGSAAPMGVGLYQSYTFYFPYTVIGKIRVSFTNANTPKYFDLGNFSVIGYHLSLDMQVATFAEMLNNTNTCSYANYADLKQVYDYLENRGVSANLANYTMEKQTAGYTNMNALEVWAAYASRAVAQKGTLTSISNRDASKNLLIVVAIVGLVGVSSLAAFSLTNKKRRKLD